MGQDQEWSFIRERSGASGVIGWLGLCVVAVVGSRWGGGVRRIEREVIKGTTLSGVTWSSYLARVTREAIRLVISLLYSSQLVREGTLFLSRLWRAGMTGRKDSGAMAVGGVLGIWHMNKWSVVDPHGFEGIFKDGDGGDNGNDEENLYMIMLKLNLWHIILNGDFPPVANNEVTQILEVVPFEEQSEDLKKKLAKNNEAKMVLYNALPKKAKVMAIEESKDLSSLALDEFIAKKESIDDETSTSGSDDEEYVMAVRNFKRCGDPNHLIGDCPKPSGNKDQKAFIGGSWSASENDEDKSNNETCLMAQSSNEVTLNSSYYSDNASSLDRDSMQIKYDSLCEISLKIINKNKILKTKRDLLEKEILELNKKIKKLERSKEIEIVCKSCKELKSENARLKETQVKFLKFDKSANLLREVLDNQKSSSCKVGLGFDSNKASTIETKPITFVGSSAEKATDGSTIKVHGSTLLGSVSHNNGEIST
ncbi:hypothetical protein Tco_1018714 [Tanacetum coccineum]|uniref:Uncharacterized protein n=1 Tax=Tanacetum coccineum TaxID=301880 RepID=A0ABQ5FW81_9ASTR